MKISWILACVIFIGTFAGVVMNPFADLVETYVSRNVKIENLEKKINELQKSLKAYEDRVDDLSAAYIRQHGNYPRRIRK